MNEIEAAVALLERGNVIGLPTETVYGLAADGTQPAAVRRIFEIKGRPQAHPLILHLGAASWLNRYCSGDLERAERLAERFWPGPLTLVLPRRGSSVIDEVTGGLDTVAVRVPNHPLALEVILALGRPVAAPSANRFGGVSPTTKDHVVADLGADVELVLDGGPCQIGLESTILDLSRRELFLLRPGAISAAEISELLGEPVLSDDGHGPKAPGTLESHYAPAAQVVLVPKTMLWNEAMNRSHTEKVGVLDLLGSNAASQQFDVEPGRGLEIFRVSGDLSDAAHELYAGLRELDRRGCDVILSSLPQLEGIGVAISDRLGRAAAPRRD